MMITPVTDAKLRVLRVEQLKWRTTQERTPSAGVRRALAAGYPMFDLVIADYEAAEGSPARCPAKLAFLRQVLAMLQRRITWAPFSPRGRARLSDLYANLVVMRAIHAEYSQRRFATEGA